MVFQLSRKLLNEKILPNNRESIERGKFWEKKAYLSRVNSNVCKAGLWAKSVAMAEAKDG
jgi:hypothetical protein